MFGFFWFSAAESKTTNLKIDFATGFKRFKGRL